VGGYNSSNTGHIVELCERKYPTYFISSEKEILDEAAIRHFDIHSKIEKVSEDYLPKKEFLNIILTSGASCPDAVVEAVLRKLLSFYDNARNIDKVIAEVIS